MCEVWAAGPVDGVVRRIGRKQQQRPVHTSVTTINNTRFDLTNAKACEIDYRVESRSLELQHDCFTVLRYSLFDSDPLSDRDELDLRLVFEPNSGPLVGLKAEIEYVDEHFNQAETPGNDLRQFRAIVNYKMPLL